MHGEEAEMTHRRWAKGALDLIGETPLVHLRTVSEACGATVLGKCEFLNPGYSVKDRIARYMVERAEEDGTLRPGGLLVEATVGTTGVGLAVVGAAKGYRTILFMPENVSPEKVDLLQALGAEVVLAPHTTWDDPQHYYAQAAAYAGDNDNAYFVDQFYNTRNVDAHYRTTGPEIWKQTGGEVDALVTGMGTTGTLVGAGRYLKERKPEVRIVASDCEGSAYHGWFHDGSVEVDGATVLEGVGIGKIPGCYDAAALDDVIRINDTAAVCMTRHLARAEGLLVGGSAGLSVAGAFRLAREGGGGKTYVTFLCDTGTRYLSRLFNEAFLREKGLWEAANGRIEEFC